MAHRLSPLRKRAAIVAGRRGVGLASVALLASVAVAGCGHSNSQAPFGPQPILGAPGNQPQAAQVLGFPGFATKNTTRVGGADAVANAAAVAEAVFVSASPSSRPQAVTLADQHNWQAALASAVLMSKPLRAPILLTDGDSLPAASAVALGTMAPTGSSSAGGAQLLRIGTHAGFGGLRAQDVIGSNDFGLAAAVDRLQSAASGAPSDAVVLVAADAPQYAMPAAAWAAKSGDPILFVTRDTLPPETIAALRAHQQPKIYILGPPTVVSNAVVTALKGLGTVHRVGAPDPISNAIAFARYTDGSFGWGITDPGHGLVFANASHTLDAAASSPLSASGSYGPLLLTTSGDALPAPLDGYLRDIQPGYDKDPARGFYNHGWLIGDQNAISLQQQANIDTLLEISQVTNAPPGAAPAAPAPSGTSAPAGAVPGAAPSPAAPGAVPAAPAGAGATPHARARRTR